LKNKLISVIVNTVLCFVVLGVSLVGFAGGGAVEVSADDDNLFYSVEENPKGVSLMFNVYQNSSNVYKILDILDEYESKATFFIGGCWADDNVDLVREINARNHEIASHGYFHKDHSSMTYTQNINEIEPSIRLLKMITGNDVKLFAPPSGAFGNNTLLACKYLNLKAIMWSRDTIDWRDSDKQLIISRATSNLKNGEFILMHPMDVTVKALPEILTYIRDNGFETVTVSYNLGE
jgi:peptidoglycan/xylan/chitin deacetylase (PgdA/CDA1 family)